MEEEPAVPMRLMNFVSEEQLDDAKKTRGERVEDGTAQRDRPLYEILRENKDKKDAEFNERFKHRPPKALDEDETEFLDNLEMSRRELERQVADEEAEQLRNFQAAIVAQSSTVHELQDKPLPLPPVKEEHKSVGKKNPSSRPLHMIIKVKPQSKKAKTEHRSDVEASDGMETPPPTTNAKSLDPEGKSTVVADKSNCVAEMGLVSYSDEESD
ncbi:unnamed protein product [Linum trigynum]|uniref:FAM192A/Fyv6 N-terminal domain-containing protein n=1 Tax=Linum trigynum TaxID=586398 RepID=A0AAV2E1V3_9ROSI